MTPLEKTLGEYEELLKKAKPEELQKAVLHAQTERLQAAKAATTTQDLQRELRERAEAALEGEQVAEGEPVPEGEAPAASPEIQRIVTFAVLTEQAKELEEAAEPSPASPEKIIERIRGRIGRTTAEAPRIAT